MDDELYFDNQDDLDLDDQLLGEDGDALDSEPSGNRGDLNIALKKEREEKRLLKEQLSQREKEIERSNALLQQFGTRREAPQVDREQLRQELADRLVERPDEVFQQRDQHLFSHFQKMNAPLYIKAAKSDVADDPEYGELYKSRPNFKKTVDAYIKNAVETHGQVDSESLNETMSYLAGIALEGKAPASNQSAKDKLKSLADKPGDSEKRKSFEQVLEEKKGLAKTNRKAYIQWADSTEGKAVLNKALKAGLM